MMRKIEAPYYTQSAMIFRLRFWGKALSINTDCGVGTVAAGMAEKKEKTAQETAMQLLLCA